MQARRCPTDQASGSCTATDAEQRSDQLVGAGGDQPATTEIRFDVTAVAAVPAGGCGTPADHLNLQHPAGVDVLHTGHRLDQLSTVGNRLARRHAGLGSDAEFLDPVRRDAGDPPIALLTRSAQPERRRRRSIGERIDEGTGIESPIREPAPRRRSSGSSGDGTEDRDEPLIDRRHPALAGGGPEPPDSVRLVAGGDVHGTRSLGPRPAPPLGTRVRRKATTSPTC